MLNSVIRSVAMVLVGLLLLLMDNGAVILLVRLLGVAFFLPALVSVVNVWLSRAEGGLSSKMIVALVGVGSMAFGVVLIARPVLFEEIFVKLLALLLLLVAVYQMMVLLQVRRKMSVGKVLFVVPLLLVVVAIVLLAVEFGNFSVTPMTYGVCALVAAFWDIVVSLFRWHSLRKERLLAENGGANKA